MQAAWKTWLDQLAHKPLEITLFDHQRVSPTWHMDWRCLGDQLIYGIIDGGLRYQLANEPEQTINGPALMWIPAGISHRLFHCEPMVGLRLYHIRWHNTSELPEQAPDMLINYHASPGLQAFSLAYQHYRENGPFAEQIVRAQLMSIHAQMLQQHYHTAKDGLSPHQRQAIESLVVRDGAEHLTPLDLAEHLALSPDYLTRQFRLSYGSAPRTWLLQQRLQRVAVDLTDSLVSMSELAERYRFADSASLSHAFRKHYGVSPTRFHQNLRQGF